MHDLTQLGRPLPLRVLVPLIVACALFMENLDATVLSTALPAIARDLHEDPIQLKLALTSYLLTLAVFIPASGWFADRFGARLIFRLEFVAKCRKIAARIYEVPISYYGRTYEEGKKVGLKDGLAAIWYLVKFKILTGKKQSFRQQHPQAKVRAQCMGKPSKYIVNLE
jgi:hypothetical protein